MTTKPAPVCNEHQILKEWRQTTFVYDEDGVSIRIPSVYAWVCPVDGDASFTPEAVDEMIATVRELLEPAKRVKERHSDTSECIVSVCIEEKKPAA